MIGIDHLMYNDYVRNTLLDDLVIDFDDARDSEQTNSLDCFTHAMVNVRGQFQGQLLWNMQRPLNMDD